MRRSTGPAEPLAATVDRASHPAGPCGRDRRLRAARRASARWRRPSRPRLEDGGVLLAEAGTGTGKTLAYLVPAILRRERVLVSTGTKNLQEQIYFKDLPVLERALGVPFKATCMKGRGELPVPAPVRRAAGQAAVRRRPRCPVRGATSRMFLHDHRRSGPPRTETGDRAEIEDLPEDLPLWNDIAATRRELPRQRVPAISTSASSPACASAPPSRTW